MCALFSHFHWLTMVAILQLKASKHFVYFVSIAVVTFTLLDILLFLDQILNVLISFCRVSQSDSELMSRQILVSSANRAIFESLSIFAYISLIKSTKRSGARIEPCGTPDSTSTLSDMTLSKITRCFLLRKYSVKNFKSVPSMLYCVFSFFRIRS